MDARRPSTAPGGPVLSPSTPWTLPPVTTGAAAPLERDASPRPAPLPPGSAALPYACCAAVQDATHTHAQPLYKRDLKLSIRADEDLSSDAETLSPTSPGSPSSGVSSPTPHGCGLMDAHGCGSGSGGVAPPHMYMNSMLEQSPIDICEMESQHVSMSPGDIQVQLSDVEAEIVHLGNNFQINWQSEERNYLKIDGKIFHTVQFHFHTPSEHTINGKQKAMEFHLVHQAADGNLAVVAIFFREGRENQFLSQFWHELPGMDPMVRNKVSVGKIDPHHLDILSGRFFRYRGSLTTPPYTEGVEWIIVQDVAEASRAQIETFRQVLPSPNARPVQPLNRRRVSLVL